MAFTGPGKDAITVGAPALTRTADGRWRVAADVDGVEMQLTAEHELDAGGDGFLAPFLLPAASGGCALHIDADVDRRLYEAVPAIQAIARRYWRFRGGPVTARRIVERAPRGGSAMFFTAGVDSFHTLMRRRDVVQRLIFVRGLNADLADLGDHARFGQVRAQIEAVARACGIPAIFAETNLRIHPTFGRADWGATHYAALAGVAHMMAPTLSRLFVASSDTRTDYGSTPELDPHWSSGAVEVVTDGAETFRLEKVKAIADWPLVHRHLKVCYEARGTELNCGRCEKCVRTQLQFAVADRVDRLTVFPRARLTELVDDLRHVDAGNVMHWNRITAQLRDPALAAAIARLLARRPSPVERLKARTGWLRKTAAGRVIRRLGKRFLEDPTPR